MNRTTGILAMAGGLVLAACDTTGPDEAQWQGSVSITPDSVLVRLGDSPVLGVEVRTETDSLVAVAVDWSTLDPTVVAVSASGKITPVAQGEAAVVARYEGMADTAVVIVVEERLLFYHAEAGERGLYVAGSGGEGPVRLTDVKSFTTEVAAAWSPDGSRIAFRDDRLASPSGMAELYVMDPYVQDPVLLADSAAGGIVAPSWSPDGQWIAESLNTAGSSEIWLIRADGGERRQLTDAPDRIDGSPAWSPDGTRIAYLSTGNGKSVIRVVNTDGTGQMDLTSASEPSGYPHWSPDGTRIVFHGHDTVNFQVYVINADGTELTDLTQNLVTDHTPVWSPDGSRIAFISRRDGNFEIYVMNADGTGQTNLTNSPEEDGAFDWSPDGSRIVFTRGEMRGEALWTMNADGSAQTRITTLPGLVALPRWR